MNCCCKVVLESQMKLGVLMNYLCISDTSPILSTSHSHTHVEEEEKNYIACFLIHMVNIHPVEKKTTTSMQKQNRGWVGAGSGTIVREP